MALIEKKTVVPETPAVTPAQTPFQIGVDTKIGTKYDVSIPSTSVAVDKPAEGTFNKFMRASRSDNMDDYSFTDEKKKMVQDNLANNFTFYDAVKDTAVGKAFKTLDLSNYDWQGGPGEDLTVLNVNTEEMRKMIDSSGEDEDTKYRYNVALNVLANAQNSGMKVVRSDDGRYWIESEEGGKKNYAINGLLDVREVVNKFYGKAPNDTIPDEDDKEIVEEEIHETIVDNLRPEFVEDEEELEPLKKIAKFELSEAEKWYLGGFAADVVTTVGGMATKGAMGTGAIVSFVGGLFSAGAEAYGDYLSGEENLDIAKNFGSRMLLEGAEAVSFVPFSLVAKLRKGSSVMKIIRRGMSTLMVLNGYDVAVSTRWNELFDKVTSNPTEMSVDDWREITRVVTAVAGLAGSATANARAGKGVKRTTKAHKAAEDAKRSTGQLKKEYTDKNLSIGTKKSYVKKTPVDDAPHKKNLADLETNKNKISKDKDIADKELNELYENAENNKKSLITKNKGAIRTGVQRGGRKPAKKLTPKQQKAEKIKKKRLEDNVKEKQAAEESLKKLREKKKRDSKKIADESNARVKKTDEDIKKEKERFDKEKEVISGEDMKIATNKRGKDIARAFGKRKRLMEKGKRRDDFNADEAKIASDDYDDLTTDAFGKRRGERIIEKARKDAGLKPKNKEFKAEKLSKIEDKKAINKGKMKDAKADLKAAKTGDKPAFRKKITKLDKEAKEIDLAISKEQDKRGGKWYKRYPNNTGDWIDDKLSYVVARKHFSNYASLKSIANSDWPIVGKGKKHYIPSTDDATLNLLMLEGYDEKDVRKLSIKQRQNAIRYIKYNGVKKKRQGGVFKPTLVSKRNAKKFTGGGSSTGAIYINNDGSISATETPYWYYDNQPEVIFTMEEHWYGDSPKGMNKQAFMKDMGITAIGGPPTLHERVTPSPDPTFHGPMEPTVVNGKEKYKEVPSIKKPIDAALLPYVQGTIIKPRPIQEFEIDTSIDTPKGLRTDTTGDVEILDGIAAAELAEAKRLAEQKRLDAAALAAIRDKYNNLRKEHGYKVMDPKADDLAAILNNIKPSDFMRQDEILEESYTRNPITSAISETAPVKGMAGFGDAVNAAQRRPGISTSDSFAKYAYDQKGSARSMENVNRLMVKNNDFVERQRQMEIANRNRNNAARVNAENQNTMAANQDNMMSAQARLKAKTDRRNYHAKSMGNRLNAFARIGQDMVGKNAKDKYRDELNMLTALNDIYETEYMPGIVAASSKGDFKGVYEFKNKFIEEQGMDPDAMRRGLLDVKARYKI